MYPKVGNIDIVAAVALPKVFQFVQQLRYIVKRIHDHTNGFHDAHGMHLRNILI